MEVVDVESVQMVEFLWVTEKGDSVDFVAGVGVVSGKDIEAFTPCGSGFTVVIVVADNGSIDSSIFDIFTFSVEEISVSWISFKDFDSLFVVESSLRTPGFSVVIENFNDSVVFSIEVVLSEIDDPGNIVVVLTSSTIFDVVNLDATEELELSSSAVENLETKEAQTKRTKKLIQTGFMIILGIYFQSLISNF